MKNKYTKEVIQFVIDNHKGKSNIELSKMVNDQFGLHTNNNNIQMLKANVRRRYGVVFEKAVNPGCIQKGNIPFNKGKKWDDYLTKEQQEKARITTYKKGNIPPNRREIYDERITKDGYIEIKIKDNSLNNNWELKHRYMYKQYYGTIPEGYNVIFLDGNRQNFEKENLKAISKAEDLIMNNNGLFTKDKELTNTGTILAQLKSKTARITN